MRITIRPDSTEPIYLQIYGSVVRALAMGDLTPGTLLPSTRRVAKDLGVNYHTVNKAYNLLEVEGFVEVRNKRVQVVRSLEESREDFMKRWRYAQMRLIREATARGLSEDELIEELKKLVHSIS